MKKVLISKNKATARTIKIIMETIRSGATQRDASALAGISEDTLSRWKREDGDFAEQMRQKEIEFKMENVKIIRKAAEKSWQAAAWFLERKYPNEYTNRVRIEQPEPHKTGFEHMTDEQLNSAIEELRRQNELSKKTINTHS
jgi:hypothetical protein